MLADPYPAHAGLFRIRTTYEQRMFIPTEATILTAVIGMVGLLATGVVLTYGFVR